MLTGKSGPRAVVYTVLFAQQPRYQGDLDMGFIQEYEPSLVCYVPLRTAFPVRLLFQATLVDRVHRSRKPIVYAWSAHSVDIFGLDCSSPVQSSTLFIDSANCSKTVFTLGSASLLTRVFFPT